MIGAGSAASARECRSYATQSNRKVSGDDDGNREPERADGPCEAIHRPDQLDLYDLLPKEDREAIEWVRGNGGLAKVEKRLMPEGMEWPRFDDDAPVKLGDIALINGEADMVEAVQLWIHGNPVIYGDNDWQQLKRGERVKRPAPKVLDADGVEIRVGDEVWNLDGTRRGVVSMVGEWDESPVNRLIKIEGDPCWQQADRFTHRAPVLAADGKPLREGETVYHVADGKAYVVHNLCEHYAVVKPEGADRFADCRFEYLTHERPEVETDKGMRLASRFAEAIVLRCRALAERRQ